MKTSFVVLLLLAALAGGCSKKETTEQPQSAAPEEQKQAVTQDPNMKVTMNCAEVTSPIGRSFPPELYEKHCKDIQSTVEVSCSEVPQDWKYEAGCE